MTAARDADIAIVEWPDEHEDAATNVQHIISRVDFIQLLLMVKFKDHRIKQAALMLVVLLTYADTNVKVMIDCGVLDELNRIVDAFVAVVGAQPVVQIGKASSLVETKTLALAFEKTLKRIVSRSFMLGCMYVMQQRDLVLGLAGMKWMRLLSFHDHFKERLASTNLYSTAMTFAQHMFETHVAAGVSAARAIVIGPLGSFDDAVASLGRHLSVKAEDAQASEDGLQSMESVLQLVPNVSPQTADATEMLEAFASVSRSMTAFTDDVKMMLVNAGFLPLLADLLLIDSMSLRYQALFVVGNVACATQLQAACLFAMRNLLLFDQQSTSTVVLLLESGIPTVCTCLEVSVPDTASDWDQYLDFGLLKNQVFDAPVDFATFDDVASLPGVSTQQPVFADKTAVHLKFRLLCASIAVLRHLTTHADSPKTTRDVYTHSRHSLVALLSEMPAVLTRAQSAHATQLYSLVNDLVCLVVNLSMSDHIAFLLTDMSIHMYLLPILQATLPAQAASDLPRGTVTELTILHSTLCAFRNLIVDDTSSRAIVDHAAAGVCHVLAHASNEDVRSEALAVVRNLVLHNAYCADWLYRNVKGFMIEIVNLLASSREDQQTCACEVLVRYAEMGSEFRVMLTELNCTLALLVPINASNSATPFARLCLQLLHHEECGDSQQDADVFTRVWGQWKQQDVEEATLRQARQVANNRGGSRESGDSESDGQTTAASGKQRRGAKKKRGKARPGSAPQSQQQKGRKPAVGKTSARVGSAKR
ncbi:hypothetical protein RI367_007805 [Sorochytrium milnesiophthora]